MKVHTEYLTFNTKKHREYIHITPQVESALRKSGVQEGMVLVSAMHITAGVYVNDNESGLIQRIDKWLEEIAPADRDYHHHQTRRGQWRRAPEVHAGAPRVIVPITRGGLDLGPLAARLLRRVRRSASQAADHQGHGRVSSQSKTKTAQPKPRRIATTLG